MNVKRLENSLIDYPESPELPPIELQPDDEPPVDVPAETKFTSVRLVIGDIPANSIADVNSRILLHLSLAVDNLKFTLEIDVTIDEGISQSTQDNRIKETTNKIGAT